MKGLSQIDAQNLIQEYGYNEITLTKRFEKLQIFIKQLASPMVYILLAACGISLFNGELIEFFIILIVLVLNTLLGYFQEVRSVSKARELKKFLGHTVAVYRDGAITQLPSREIVPGDRLLLLEGDRLPADGTISLSDAPSIELNESAVTGESVPVTKRDGDEGLSGTFVARGLGELVVTKTGLDTFVGSLSKDLQVKDNTGQHFQKKINSLTYLISGISIVLFIMVIVLSNLRGEDLGDSLLYAISILVSGIPEGLPALITLALTAASIRMAKGKAIIKKLEASVAIGEVTTIITDKTGTLTKNIMRVEEAFTREKRQLVLDNTSSPDHKLLLLACKYANTIPQETLLHGDFDESILDPTEKAMYEYWYNSQELHKDWHQVAYSPFDSIKGYQEIELSDGIQTIHTRVGAPESILEFTSHTAPRNVEETLQNIIKKGGRSIAIAVSKDQNDYKFIGLLHISDELREDAPATITKAQNLGVRVIMATGDHPNTAVYFASKSGIEGEHAITGKEFLGMNEEERTNAAKSQNIFARMTPEAKKQLSITLQNLGENVGMTGDGVNDAPVLKFADIGIAMGQGGTEIAKEAADIILTNDNLSVIIGAIKQGRILFQNVYSGITYLVSTNLGELAVFLFTLILGLPAPLTAIQILFQNLITDGLNGLALTTKKELDNPKFNQPIPKSQGFLDKENRKFLISNTLGIGLGGLAIVYVHADNIEYMHTLVFLYLAFTQIVNLYTCKNLGGGVIGKKMFENIYINLAFVVSFAITVSLVFSPLRNTFELTIPALGDVLIVAQASVGMFLINEVMKKTSRR